MSLSALKGRVYVYFYVCVYVHSDLQCSKQSLRCSLALCILNWRDSCVLRCSASPLATPRMRKLLKTQWLSLVWHESPWHVTLAKVTLTSWQMQFWRHGTATSNQFYILNEENAFHHKMVAFLCISQECLTMLHLPPHLSSSFPGSTAQVLSQHFRVRALWCIRILVRTSHDKHAMVQLMMRAAVNHHQCDSSNTQLRDTQEQRTLN